MEYLFERLSRDNLGMLVPLYRAVFGQAISEEFLLKKYNTAAFGTEYIGFMAFTSDSQLVGFYGVIPCHFLAGGQTILAAQSADTMTHPAHRNKGLFVTLAAKTYALAKEQYIDFIFGFPNQNSQAGFIKLGWRFLEDKVQVFSLNAGGFGYAKLFRYVGVFFNLYKVAWSKLYNVQAGIDLFPDQPTCGVKHDNLFFQYKRYSDTMVLSVDNTRLWAKVDGKLKVGAVSGLTELNCEQFIDTLSSIARRLGCDKVIFMTTTNSTLYSMLVNRLVPKGDFPIGFLPLKALEYSLDEISFEGCDIDIF